jgi:hypothetical protein
MPLQSQYQNVFRVAKPNGTKRVEANGKGKTAARDVSTDSHNGHDTGNSISQAQLRLQYLETLVTTLMQTAHAKAAAGKEHSNVVAFVPPEGISDTSSTGTSGALHSAQQTTSSPPLAAVSMGHLDIAGTEIKYRGSTHWLAILENVRSTISALRDIFLTCT